MKRVVYAVAAGLAVAVLSATPAFSQSDSVTIDDQPTTEQNLGRINDLRRAGRHGDAADLLQELIDEARFKLITRDPGLYIDAELWARQELSRDPALLAAYRGRYTASAERALGLAIEDGSMSTLREAYRRFGMTRPGLDMGLTLAGRLLERGDLPAASAMVGGLARHPDQRELRSQILYLRGVCAALGGDAELAGDLGEELALVDADRAAHLSRLTASLALPTGAAGGGLVEAGAFPEGLDLPLWDAPIDESARPGRSTFDGFRSLPVVSGERLFVNTRRQVLALDRASGEQLWAYPTVSGGRGIGTNQSDWTDTRGVSVSGGRVFAVVGACQGLQGRGGVETVRSNLLVSLDERSGVVRWSRESGEVGESEPAMQLDGWAATGSMRQSHFVGTPVAAQGQVFALVRRTNSRSGGQTVWLASFDAQTGQMRWFRHLALVQVHHGPDSMRLTPQLRLDGETIYVSDQIAVAAAVDVHSGAYRWVRVLADNSSRRSNNNLALATDGVNTPPVMTPSGLVVHLSTSTRRLFLLDPASGRTLRELHEDNRLAQVQYVLDAGGHAIVVSRTYALLWDGDSGEVRWVHSFAQDAMPSGQGAVTRQFAVIPTEYGITALRLADGEVVEEVQTQAGNLTALDEEVLVSTNGRVSSYMSWAGAYERLVDRVHRLPNDPGPGLSLASLALNRGDRDAAVLEGLGFALGAVERLVGDEAVAERARVFEVLRRMAQADSAADNPLRAELFDLMALTAASAEQAVAYHLDLGWHLAQSGDPALAVGHYQAVMVDPALSDTGYSRPGTHVTGPAGASAQREMLALVREHGRGIYRRYDALAQQELESAIAGGRPAPEALGQIAKRYPLSLSASRALLMAAEQLEQQGQPVGALDQYQQAFTRAITDDQRAEAAGALLGYYERSARPGDALPLLDMLSRDARRVVPPRDGVSTSIAQWREVFVAMEGGAMAWPELASGLGRPTVLPGRLLLPPEGTGPQVLAGGLFVHTEEGAVARLDARRGGAVVWSVPVEGDRLHVLADDQGQVLVWSVDASKLYAVDSATGRLLWDEPADLGVLAQPAAGPAPLRPAAHAGADQPFVHVGPTVVCFAAMGGRVIGIDRYRGRVRWEVETGIARVSAVAADPWTLAVAGVVGPELNLRDGKLVLLDLYTGDPVLDDIDLHVGFAPRVVGVSARHITLVSERSAEVSVIDAVTGEGVLRQQLTNTSIAAGRVNGPLVVLGEAGGMALALRADAGGRVLGRFRLAGSRDAGDIRVLPLGAGLLAHGPNGAVALDADGDVRWRNDQRYGEGGLHHALIGAQRVALVSAISPTTHPDRLLARGESVSYRLDLVDRDGGLLQRTYTLGPIHGQLDPRQSVVSAGGIAMSMGPQTLLLPPGEEPTPDSSENAGR